MERMKKLVLIQIPKTGSKTLTARLTRVYGKQKLWKDGTEENYHKELFWGLRNSFPTPNYTVKRESVSKSYFAKNFNCIVGSFPASKFQYLKDEGWLLAIWMRDPLKRRISWYNRNWNNIKHRKYWDYPNEPSDIVSIIKKQKNVYKAYCDVSMDELDFVGFTETFDKSCAELYRLLKIKERPANTIKNVGKYTIEVTDEQREIMREWLDEEYKIYNEAKELWLNRE